MSKNHRETSPEGEEEELSSSSSSFAATVLMMLIPFFRAPTSRPRFSPQHSASDAHVRLPFEHLGVDGFRVLAREGHG